MLNVYELEKKHRVYKLKSYIPYIIIFASLALILSIALLIYSSDIFKSSEAKNKKHTTTETQAQQESRDIVKELDKQDKSAKVVVDQEKKSKDRAKDQSHLLTPSLNFIASIKHSSPSIDVNYQNTIDRSKKEKKTKEIKKEKKVLKAARKEPKAVVVEEVKLQRGANVKIHRQDTKKDMEHVINRFEKNNNPALSLFIAKKYYEQEDYHQSYNYALITNRINDNIDASWIIFAKSLVKLDRKDEALKTLKRYIKHSKSTKAQTLLEEIERGRFR